MRARAGIRGRARVKVRQCSEVPQLRVGADGEAVPGCVHEHHRALPTLVPRLDHSHKAQVRGPPRTGMHRRELALLGWLGAQSVEQRRLACQGPAPGSGSGSGSGSGPGSGSEVGGRVAHGWAGGASSAWSELTAVGVAEEGDLGQSLAVERTQLIVVHQHAPAAQHRRRARQQLGRPLSAVVDEPLAVPALEATERQSLDVPVDLLVDRRALHPKVVQGAIVERALIDAIPPFALPRLHSLSRLSHGVTCGPKRSGGFGALHPGDASRQERRRREEPPGQHVGGH